MIKVLIIIYRTWKQLPCHVQIDSYVTPCRLAKLLLQCSDMWSFCVGQKCNFFFSEPLINRMAQAVGVEARAKHNEYSKQGNYGDHTGLSCFAPVINIMRHPLWGRNQVSILYELLWQVISDILIFKTKVLYIMPWSKNDATVCVSKHAKEDNHFNNSNASPGKDYSHWIVQSSIDWTYIPRESKAKTWPVANTLGPD